jgi:acyl-CoA thioester hydrolase
MSDDFDLSAFRTRSPTRFTLTMAVRYGDLDPNGHVNHMLYLAFLEECRLAHRRDLDVRLQMDEKLGWPVGGLNIRYIASLTYPGDAVIESAPIKIGRTSFTLGYGIYRGDTVMALAYSQTVCIDNRLGRSVRLPDALVQDIKEEMARA